MFARETTQQKDFCQQSQQSSSELETADAHPGSQTERSQRQSVRRKIRADGRNAQRFQTPSVDIRSHKNNAVYGCL